MLEALPARDSLVTVWDEMRQARAADRPIYFRLDTHWTNRGAAVMAEALVNRLAPGGWDETAVQLGATIDHEGDLTVLLGLPSTEPADELETALPGTSSSRTVRALLAADGSEYEKVVAVDYAASREPVVAGHTLVMHDSYGWALTPMLAPYFETAAFVAASNPSDGHLWDDLMAAETIVFEIVQRSAHEYFLDRDLAAGFVAAYSTEFDASASGTKVTGDRLELAPSDRAAYVIVELAPGTEAAEVAYNEVTAVLSPQSPRAAYHVGMGGTMFFAGEVDYRMVFVEE